MRVIFAGTPSVALPTLEALVDSQHEVVAVLTREDALVGRKRTLTPSPVAAWALERGIPVVQANRITSEVTDALRMFKADLGVVVAFGGLLPQDALDALPAGWVNLHFSALPSWRGAAPVQWQLINGADSIATTVFQLVAELDAGDIFSVMEQAVYPWETAHDVLQRLSVSGATQVVDVVGGIAAGTLIASPQHGAVTIAPKLTRAVGRLDPEESASAVYARFRGVTSEPGAWIGFRADSLKILAMSEAAQPPQVDVGRIVLENREVWLGTASQALKLESVQPAGRPAMKAVDWFRGLQSSESVAVDVI
jgi:methionyl-tRNA formyltransferase